MQGAIRAEVKIVIQFSQVRGVIFLDCHSMEREEVLVRFGVEVGVGVGVGFEFEVLILCLITFAICSMGIGDREWQTLFVE